ncbi:MAG: hypothetical protein PWQ55_2425 [Chloroflexota bacterium]|nr:hypothetical protein [Chloroflexota bacterium]
MGYCVRQERPDEIAYIFNPPFCCTVLTSSIVGFKHICHIGMPYPTIYLILPLILHKETRKKLPRNSRTNLAAWVETNPDAKFFLLRNILSLKQITNEALLFGANKNWIFFKSGNILTDISNPKISSIAGRWNDGEVRDCILKARLVGTWLAKAGSTETIMGLLGVRP